MEYEKCYVYQPTEDRPAKRRRTEPQGLHTSWKLRRRLYEEAWGDVQQRIDERLNSINTDAVEVVAGYIDQISPNVSANRIPAGFVLAGANATSHNSVLQQLATKYKADRRTIFVALSSNAGGNLKALLKSINQKSTLSSVGEDEDEDDPGPGRQGPRLLNYDLQILHNHVREKAVDKVVLTFQDTEAFDSALLSELIELLSCWLDRIPFVCLFSIATSVGFLQQRLSKSAVRCIDGRLFDVSPSNDEIEEVLAVLVEPRNDGAPPLLWIGSSLMSSILDRQHDYIQSIRSLVKSAKYAYMSAYYANALCVFIHSDNSSSEVSREHVEALRHTSSFQLWARQQLESDSALVRTCLEDDGVLVKQASAAIKSGHQAFVNIMTGIRVVRSIQLTLHGEHARSKQSSLYVQAMSNKLKDSAVIRNLLIGIRKSPSNIAADLLSNLSPVIPRQDQHDPFQALQSDLDTLLSAQSDATIPLRSEDDLKNSTLRTTVVAQKVELSKHKFALSAQDAAYTSLLRRFTDALEAYFADAFIDPKGLLFHEIFLYDLRSPWREVFTPRPRHAIERALAAPHDYLGCDCCAPESVGREGEGGDGGGTDAEATLSATQPATAILYQLYLESGSLINASDLWHAFQAVLGSSVEPEEQVMALFQRALAELKYLGLVKGTRKKADHIAKVSWRGL